jgi:hypothetical protein
MLVTHHQGNFTKKAVGKITFTCSDGELIDGALQRTIQSGEGQTVSMRSVGIDEQGAQVSSYTFEWSVRLKPKK